MWADAPPYLMRVRSGLARVRGLWSNDVTKNALTPLGWDLCFQDQHPAELDRPNTFPARVTREDRGMLEIIAPDEHGSLATSRATIAGSIYHRAERDGLVPAVGDWVVADRTPSGDVRVLATYARKGVLTRQAAGTQSRQQVLAANVDVAFIVTSFTMEFDPRRLERYLTTVWDAGAMPVVVLNKLDLSKDPTWVIETTEASAMGAPVIPMSAQSGDASALHPYLGAGKTCVLLGSSGVGKSTLTNALLREERQLTRDIREDDAEGRHTTTARHMFVLPHDMGVLIDTPGMRELGLWVDPESVDLAFDDIVSLAQSCKFRDCAHDTEPGCAVRAAIEHGDLDPKRFSSWLKLQREAAYHARKASVAAQRAQSREWGKMVREVSRYKTKRK